MFYGKHSKKAFRKRGQTATTNYEYYWGKDLSPEKQQELAGIRSSLQGCIRMHALSPFLESHP